MLQCVACNDSQPGPNSTTTLAANYILIDGSLNYVVSKSDYSALNTLMISEEECLRMRSFSGGAEENQVKVQSR